MAHNHNIVENDPYFEINPHTREVTYTGEKAELLIQYDHNSERFTFRMPQIIEGHDMLISDRVEIHFKNIGSRSDEETSGVYYVSDLAQIEGTDQIKFSWLVGKASTVYAGVLKFIIRFVCLKDNGKVDYSWSTGVCSGKWIGEGMNNNNSIDEEYISTLTITANGTYDVSQYDKVTVNISAGEEGTGSGSGDSTVIAQRLTILNSRTNATIATYLMPAGYTFEDFIGSEYDTSDGLLSLGWTTDLTTGFVLYNHDDVKGEDGGVLKSTAVARGTCYVATTQLLWLYETDLTNTPVQYEMPEGYTFGDFINSEYDNSGGLFRIELFDNSDDIGMVYYCGTQLKSSSGNGFISNKSTAAGKFIYG